jgi:DNA-binding MarR family transcriptional regulator
LSGKPRVTKKISLDLDKFLPFELAVIANRVSRMVGTIFDEKYGLQIPEWRILVSLDHHGALSPNDIVARTSMDKARVSRAQRRLSDLQLVTIIDDPEDGRRKVLQLSAKGREICKEIVPEAINRESWLLESLSAAEQVALNSIMSKLHARTEEIEP